MRAGRNATHAALRDSQSLAGVSLRSSDRIWSAPPIGPQARSSDRAFLHSPIGPFCTVEVDGLACESIVGWVASGSPAGVI